MYRNVQKGRYLVSSAAPPFLTYLSSIYGKVPSSVCSGLDFILISSFQRGRLVADSYLCNTVRYTLENILVYQNGCTKLKIKNHVSLINLLNAILVIRKNLLSNYQKDLQFAFFLTYQAFKSQEGIISQTNLAERFKIGYTFELKNMTNLFD